MIESFSDLSPTPTPARSAPRSAERDFRLHFGGFTFGDLFEAEPLRALDTRFRAELAAADADLATRYEAYRKGSALGPVDESNLLIEVAPHVAFLVARLFGIEAEWKALCGPAHVMSPLWKMRREVVQRRALKRFSAEKAKELDLEKLEAQIASLQDAVDPNCPPGTDDELRAARTIAELIDLEYAYRNRKQDGAIRDRCAAMRTAIAAKHELAERVVPRDGTGDEAQSDAADLAFVQKLLDVCEQWAAARFHQPAGRERIAGWASFKLPHPTDYEHLVHLHRPRADLPELLEGPPQHLRDRDGFGLTDPRMTKREILAEVDYCLFCHDRDKDSCSKGLRKKDGAITANPLGVALNGCPLDEKISEMHTLMQGGDPIGALALVVIDNPMVPGTGHRICNDCMKACIFQKQEPVNIPQIETGALTDVLKLPYGFEIYSLLTRWNPLNRRRPFHKAYNGKNVLVVGVGPAGYTLAHHLLGEGFGVVAIDGLKLEPLADDLRGADQWPPRAVRTWAEVYENLDERILLGFGGVSEYGITVRWDKNFLSLIYLSLLRERHCRIYGGIRFGGTITLDDAWGLGFDHVAIAAGAGKPTLIDIENNLIPGIRLASDFLMALQLTGAFKKEMLANLQVELPAVVIGGGLTATDAATELAAYYPIQVEKMLLRYEELTARYGEKRILGMYNADEQVKLQRFLEHGLAVRSERARAALAGEVPRFTPLIHAWGGVTIAYRRRLNDSPAYRLNHEEVQKMLEEGIFFAEHLSPTAAVPDASGHVTAMVFERQTVIEGKLTSTGEKVTLPARTVCVAAGTSPNIIYEREFPGTFLVDAKTKSFKPHKLVRDDGGARRLVPGEPGERAFFTSYERAGKLVSFYGDNHPTYAGSVVKAMASGKDGHPYVVDAFAEDLAALLPENQPARLAAWDALAKKLDDGMRARVVEVRRLTPTIVDVIVRAPLAARRFEPGQFYRLQNLEIDAPVIGGVKLAMEGIALTGAWVDPEAGLLSLITLELGVSSRLCATLRPGQEVIVMGPTGAPTEIPENERVLLAGGGLGNAVLFSIGKALRGRNNRVVYFAAYKRKEDVFKREEIERASDQIVWSVDDGELIEPGRPEDVTFRGNIVEAMEAFAKGELGAVRVALDEVDRIIAIGSDRMMEAVGAARHGVLKAYLKPEHTAISSINSPMQCMMKEVCAQCLQKHRDPVTGEERFVFTCFNQDQFTDRVDFKNLRERLRQNDVQEKLSNLYFNSLLERDPGILLV